MRKLNGFETNNRVDERLLTIQKNGDNGLIQVRPNGQRLHLRSILTLLWLWLRLLLHLRLHLGLLLRAGLLLLPLLRHTHWHALVHTLLRNALLPLLRLSQHILQLLLLLLQLLDAHVLLLTVLIRHDLGLEYSMETRNESHG